MDKKLHIQPLSTLELRDFEVSTPIREDIVHAKVDHLRAKAEHEYRSCCGQKTDDRLLLRIVQVLVSFSVIGLCVVQLSIGELDCPNQHAYYTLMGSVISFWFATVSASVGK